MILVAGGPERTGEGPRELAAEPASLYAASVGGVIVIGDDVAGVWFIAEEALGRPTFPPEALLEALEGATGVDTGKGVPFAAPPRAIRWTA